MNQHVMPKLNRRAFVIGTAAVGAGLRARPRSSASAARPWCARADGSPEVNAWVVIRPDDTVVIRIARSEMGQGTLTGLRPAGCRRTRMRLVEGHDRISDARSERRPQARMGRFLDRRQPRHPHLAGLRAQGRRHRARDADPGRRQRMEGAGLGMHRGQQRHHPHALGPDHDLRQVVEAAAKLEPPADGQAEGSQGLEDRRQGRCKRLDTRGQDHRQDDLRHRCQIAGHAQCRDQGLPGVRRQVEEL